jgi:hypothetical protein
MEAEIPEAILKEDARTQKEWEWCNAFVADPSANFKAWLDKNTIDIVPERIEKRGSIYSRLRAKGLLPAWETYKQTTKAEWKKWPESRKRKDNKPGRFSPAVQKEMLWRLAETKLLHVSEQIEAVREQFLATGQHELSSEQAKYLPPEMAWVAGHPCLSLTFEQEKEDPVMGMMAKRYDGKCPNQMAKNWFNTLRGDGKALPDFWKQIQTKWSEEVKRTNAKPDDPEGEETQANEDHVASLEEMLGIK